MVRGRSKVTFSREVCRARTKHVDAVFTYQPGGGFVRNGDTCAAVAPTPDKDDDGSACAAKGIRPLPLDRASVPADKGVSTAERATVACAGGVDEDPNPAWMTSHWDRVMLFMLLFCATCTPFEVAFLRSRLDALFFVNRVVDLFFIVDIGVNFVRAFWDNDAGMWVTSRVRIARNYLRGWFLLDVVSILPIDILSVAMEASESGAGVGQLKILRVIRVFRLAKLLRVARASRILARLEEHMAMSYCTLSLLKYAAIVVFTSHWVACAWHIVLVLESGDAAADVAGGETSAAAAAAEWEQNWLNAHLGGEAAARAPASERYVVCLYFALMTLSTVGYGDVVAVTTAERVFCVLLFLCGGALWAYVVGAVCAIVASLDKATNEFHLTMDELNIFMKDETLPMEMRVRLRRFFRYSRSMQRRVYQRKLLMAMSPLLRGQVAAHAHQAWVSAVPFFGQSPPAEHDDFCAAIAVKLDAVAFVAGEFVIKPFQPADAMFIVRRGEVLLRSGVRAALATERTCAGGAAEPTVGEGTEQPAEWAAETDHRRTSVAKRGCFFGEDMVAAVITAPATHKRLPPRRRGYSARATTFIDVFRFSAESLLEILAHNQFPLTKELIARHAQKIGGTSLPKFNNLCL
eukprot:g4838.t1